MHPHLLRALACIDENTRSLTTDQIGRPVPGRWSIAQILEHLTLAYSAGTQAVERVLASGELRVSRPGPRARLAQTVVIDLGYIPRVKSPQVAEPKGLVTAAQSRHVVRHALRTLDETLVLVAERFGDRQPVFNHPYLGGMSVRQWRKFHWRHTAHHMKQVQERARLQT